jgi:hypothetical protein
MSSFLLENIRSNMETLEQTEKAIVMCLFNKLENVNSQAFLNKTNRMLIQAKRLCDRGS